MALIIVVMVISLAFVVALVVALFILLRRLIGLHKRPLVENVNWMVGIFAGVGWFIYHLDFSFWVAALTSFWFAAWAGVFFCVIFTQMTHRIGKMSAAKETDVALEEEKSGTPYGASVLRKAVIVMFLTSGFMMFVPYMGLDVDGSRTAFEQHFDTNATPIFSHDPLPAGFIALSESPMNWADAVAWCQQQGGRLPRIDNRDLVVPADFKQAKHIDGFGANGGPWPSGLPDSQYWTGTVASGDQDSACVILASPIRGNVFVMVSRQSRALNVLCVAEASGEERATTLREAGGGSDKRLPLLEPPHDQVAAQYAATLQRAAEQGDAIAQYNLGVMYRNGQEVPKDYAIAAKWFHKAAEQGEPQAQRDLGLAYAAGRGVAEDMVIAVNWLRKAAEQEDRRALYALGLAYAAGRGVPEDEVKAAQLWLKSAELEYFRAQNRMAYAYFRGQGVAKDESRAAYWSQKAHAGARLEREQREAGGVSGKENER